MNHQQLKKTLVFTLILFFGYESNYVLAQNPTDSLHLTLEQVVQRGMDSSKKLHISTAKIDEAMAKWKQTKDALLPNIKLSFSPSEAFMLTRKLQIDGMMPHPMDLPSSSTVYMATLGINQTIFAGNQYRYAQKSSELLHHIAQLNAASDSENVKLDLIQSYINLYKINENQKILDKELEDVQERLDEVTKFRDQGLATDNDVLRFKLQKANVEMTQIDLMNNRMVANYALCILLGLPEGTLIAVENQLPQPTNVPSLSELTQNALSQREELAVFDSQNQLREIEINRIKKQRLPTLGAGINSYYINPNDKFIPDKNSYLVPITIGLNLSWNVSSMYKTKNKIAEAQAMQTETKIAQSATEDQVKIDVNKHYLNYLQSLKKVQVLQTSIEQAQENDRTMELKYQNQLVTTTDRIDAQTMLYQALVNLNIAKANVATAYFQLLRASGKLKNNFNF